MEDAQASAAGLAFVLRSRAYVGAAGFWLHLLFRGGAVGLLPSRQTALWLHGALQEKEQRSRARGQRARSPAVNVCFQLSVRCVHRERSERDGPRAAGAAQWRE